MQTISVVIPAFNEERYIAECLRSIRMHGGGRIREIIVVDNASTDRTAEVASGIEGVTVVREPKKGTSAARHRGYLAATGDLLAFIDADCRLTPEWAEIVEKAFREEPDLICVSGMFRYYDLARHKELIIRTLWRSMGGIANLFTGYLVVGGNFVAKRSAVERIGGFDTSITFYGDDTHFARRLKTVGRIRFIPRLSVVTSGRRWTDEGFARIGLRYGLNFLWPALFGKPYTKTHKDVR